jgi:hypothetical protein
MLKAHDSFSAQAANTLTVDQKAKLKTLQDALALMAAIHQAAGFGLLALPFRMRLLPDSGADQDREGTGSLLRVTEVSGSSPAASGQNPRGRVAPTRSSGRRG